MRRGRSLKNKIIVIIERGDREIETHQLITNVITNK